MGAKDELESAAKRLFFRHGTRRVTVEDISKEAGVSKVTFYKYFENKKVLAKSIRDQLVEEGFRVFDEISEQDMSFPDKVDQMTAWRRDFFAPMDPDFIEYVFSLGDVQQEFKKRFIGNMAAAREKGEVRDGISLELVWLVMEKLSELAADGSWKDVVSDYGEYQAQVRRLFYRGLLISPEGEKR